MSKYTDDKNIINIPADNEEVVAEIVENIKQGILND